MSYNKEIVKKRIGKDLAFKWAITTNGESLPLEGRDLKLELRDRNDVKQELPFEVDNDCIMFCFRGRQQKTLGKYIFTLWENYGKNGQTAVDNIALELVQYSWQENG